ncbi:MAG: septation protein IspZ [Inhella sp.]
MPSPLDAVSQARAAAQWQRSKSSIVADLALGLLFIVVAKLTDLTTATLVGAGAGLGLVVVQRFVKVDLLGGLALFGVFMLLVSAVFSLVFQDDNLVKLKGTILGLFTAALFLGDGLLNRGRYFGRRLARYVMQPVHEQRLAIGLSVLGAVMAGLNWVVAKAFSTHVWLTYNSVGDILLSMLLFLLVLRYARA